MPPSIGLGVVTHNRTLFFAKTMAAIVRYCSPVVDQIYVQDDHGDEPAPRRDDLYQLEVSPINEGVGKAKNRLLRRMIEREHDWLILAENDCVPLSEKAVTGYVEACEKSGYHHLSFHAHGPANTPGYLETNEWVTIWPEYVGAWCIYSRECLESVGLFDEEFNNAWEHVEHSVRLGQHAYTYAQRGAADATGSEAWIREIPGSIETSTIRHTDEWVERMQKGRDYWKEKDAESYALVFGDE